VKGVVDPSRTTLAQNSWVGGENLGDLVFNTFGLGGSKKEEVGDIFQD